MRKVHRHFVFVTWVRGLHFDCNSASRMGSFPLYCLIDRHCDNSSNAQLSKPSFRVEHDELNRSSQIQHSGTYDYPTHHLIGTRQLLAEQEACKFWFVKSFDQSSRQCTFEFKRQPQTWGNPVRILVWHVRVRWKSVCLQRDRQITVIPAEQPTATLNLSVVRVEALQEYRSGDVLMQIAPMWARAYVSARFKQIPFRIMQRQVSPALVG